ncbi:hypothetical protein H072_3839 [Dactylellina haptotyla CBS 200.50]|uniref:Clr5 domain-containing protein n=1 Tax=Dactylellina haptotyla (strain CBS 200.50) TaxID=1284197 RepID=S8AGE3_DACHA|nr:hypothetical protein H072_3839 [Dactylellina haptotyla CBS 200.50]
MAERIIEVNPAEPGHRYLRLKDIEPFKEFILAKYNAGVRQKHIISALKTEKGVTLRPHNLKRLLEKWKISNKNLTLKRKLFIRNALENRRRNNKYVHRVKLGRSERELSREEIANLMAHTPNYFEGVQPSPGDVIINTPTPTSTYPGTGDTEAHMLAESTVGGDLVFTQAINSLSIGADNQYSNYISGIDYIATDNVDDIAGDLTVSGAGWKGVLSAEQGLHDSGTLPQTNDTIEDLQEIISSGLIEFAVGESHSALVSTDNQGSGSPSTEDFTLYFVGLDDDSGDAVGESLEQGNVTPLAQYAQRNEHRFRDRVALWEKDASSYMQRVWKLSEDAGISQAAAAEKISLRDEEIGVYDGLPYHIYAQILETQVDLGQHFDNYSEDNASWIQFIEDNFSPIKESICQLPPNHFAREPFDTYVVHIPTLLKKYGPRHFFTACGHYFAGNIPASTNLDRDVRGRWVFRMLSRALQIFDDIGMSCHIFAFNCLYELSLLDMYTDPELVRAVEGTRDSVRKNTLMKYGRHHHRTLFVYAELATRMVKIPERRQEGELMVYGIVHTIEHSIHGFSSHIKKPWVFRTLVLLAETLLECGNYRLVIKLLEAGAAWEKEQMARKNGNKAFRPVSNFSKRLGIAYRKLGMYKQSLEVLFAWFHDSKEVYGLSHNGTFRSMEYITEVMDARGPVLYSNLEPTFDKLFTTFAASGKINNRVYDQLWKAWERGGINTNELQREYGTILSLRSTSHTSPTDLQDYVYFQGLEEWMYSQGAPVDSSQSGWVEELEFKDEDD